MGAVALDADVIIGFLDPSDAQHSRAVTALRPWLSGDQVMIAGATVYSEVLVRPLQRGLEAHVEAFFDAARITIVPVDRDIAREAARLRAKHVELRLPDALALATAARNDAELLTLDRRLAGIVSAESSR